MKRIAVFGNAGGGKSTLSRRLAEITGLPLYPLDQIKYLPGGLEVPHEKYISAHSELLKKEEWIIDGFGDVKTAWERFSKADTLIYIDFPLSIHYWFVIKRLFQGIYKIPEGWPEYSPIWKGTLNSFKVIPLCHRHLTPKYRKLVEESISTKQVYHITSLRESTNFLNTMRLEYNGK